MQAEVRHATRLARLAAAAAGGLIVLAGAVAWLDIGLLVDASQRPPDPVRTALAVVICIGMVVVFLWRAAVNWSVYRRITRAVDLYVDTGGRQRHDAAMSGLPDARTLVHAVNGTVSAEMAVFLRRPG